MLRSEIRGLERRDVVRGWTRHETATIAEKTQRAFTTLARVNSHK